MVRRLTSYLRQHHIALLALFVALGGTSYAAIKLPANSVGSSQIKNKAVTPKKLSSATVKSLKGKKGAAGPKGATGPQGMQGVQGPAGATAWAFASSTKGAGSETALTGSPTTLLSLAGDGSQITTSVTSGLIATATFNLKQTGAGAGANANCHLKFGGPTPSTTFDLHVDFAGLNDVKQLALTGAASRPPGTYDVSVECAGGGAGSIGYSAGMLTVHAAAG